MMRSSDRTADRLGAETFYARFWTERAKKGLRRDELDRWAVIEELIAHALDHLPTPTVSSKGPRVLDLGCGRGWITKRLTETIDGADVLGIDPVETGIEIARDQYPNLVFGAATAQDLLVAGEGGSFDLLVASEVIEHVPREDQAGFLADTFELLRAGAFLILTTPRGELWSRWKRGNPRLQPVEDWLTESELVRLAARTGLELCERTRAHVPNRPLTWQGWLDKWIFGRWLIRDLPLGWLRRRLQSAARLYQVLLLRRPATEDDSA